MDLEKGFTPKRDSAINEPEHGGHFAFSKGLRGWRNVNEERKVYESFEIMAV